MCCASTFPFFTHVEVDGLNDIPLEDSDILRLPASHHLQMLEQLRQEFFSRWGAGDTIEDLIQRIFEVSDEVFMPAHPPRYIVGYNVICSHQARVFARVMRDLDRYIAVLSQFALRVRVLSVTQPLPEHPSGYPNLHSVLRTVRYVGEGLWLRALGDFERQRRQCRCWRYLPDNLIADGSVPERLADAVDLVLYKAQIVRILASEPVREVRQAVEEGATEYVRALHALLVDDLRHQRQRHLRRRALATGVLPVSRRRRLYSPSEPRALF